MSASPTWTSTALSGCATPPDTTPEPPLGEDLRRHAAAQETASRCQREHPCIAALQQAEPFEPVYCSPVERALQPCELERLVQPQAEQHALAAEHVPRQLLQLPRWLLAGRERREVRAEARRRPPASSVDCRDRADAEAQVVPSPPVREVVPRAQVAAVREPGGSAEVRRLVPAVAGRTQARDDALEVGLHRLGLTRELRAVRMREARSRLCLQLVTGDVLGLQRQRVAQVGVEIGGALAGDSVDEIQRDVVKLGIAKSVDGASDVVGPGLPVEHLEQPGPEALRAE